MISSMLDLLAQSNNGGAAAGGAAAMICSCIMFLIGLGFAAVVIAGMWKVFVKAGQPGWAAIVPIYNMVIWCKIVGRPEWWVLLLLIPFVNLIFAILLSIDLAKSFGKDIGYALGIIFLGFIFIPMLGFGSAQYQGPSVSQ